VEQATGFIGMDVHKDTIAIAVTATGDAGKATPYGTFSNTAAALEKLVKRLRQAGSGPLKFCYEAGPCGYGVHRTLTRLGEDCMVVAPSMIPRKSGDRQKNDERDAASLAVLHRGGLVTAVWVPDASHEAMRDLIRTRVARGEGSAHGPSTTECISAAPRADLSQRPEGLDQGASRMAGRPELRPVLEKSIEAVRLGEQRRDRIEGYLRAQIPTWSLFPLVRNLSALRGLDTIASAGLAAAIGDPSRFASAPDFMAYLGLVPSEHSSGPKRRIGAITKAGDVHARTLLINQPPPGLAFEISETVDGGNGRTATRRHAVCQETAWLTSDRRYPGEPRFPDLAMIGRVESEVERDGKIERETRYYVSSAALSAEMFGRVVRGHWGIENRLHWILDVVFREDLARLRSGNAHANMAIARHTALNLLSDARPTTSFKNRRKKAGWNVDYLETVLRRTA
jgi:transposase/predicted transposase YbfD/YdcC